MGFSTVPEGCEGAERKTGHWRDPGCGWPAGMERFWLWGGQGPEKERAQATEGGMLRGRFGGCLVKSAGRVAEMAIARMWPLRDRSCQCVLNRCPGLYESTMLHMLRALESVTVDRVTCLFY